MNRIRHQLPMNLDTPIDHRSLSIAASPISYFRCTSSPTSLGSRSDRQSPTATARADHRAQRLGRCKHAGDRTTGHERLRPLDNTRPRTNRRMPQERLRNLHRTHTTDGSTLYTLATLGETLLLQWRRPRDLHPDRPLSRRARRPSHTTEHRGLQLPQPLLARGSQPDQRGLIRACSLYASNLGDAVRCSDCRPQQPDSSRVLYRSRRKPGALCFRAFLQGDAQA